MAPILTARERDVLDYLRRQAEARLIDSLPTAQLRVMAALTPPNPPHGKAFAPSAWWEFHA